MLKVPLLRRFYFLTSNFTQEHHQGVCNGVEKWARGLVGKIVWRVILSEIGSETRGGKEGEVKKMEGGDVLIIW